MVIQRPHAWVSVHKKRQYIGVEKEVTYLHQLDTTQLSFPFVFPIKKTFSNISNLRGGHIMHALCHWTCRLLKERGDTHLWIDTIRFVKKCISPIPSIVKVEIFAGRNFREHPKFSTFREHPKFSTTIKQFFLLKILREYWKSQLWWPLILLHF